MVMLNVRVGFAVLPLLCSQTRFRRKVPNFPGKRAFARNFVMPAPPRLAEPWEPARTGGVQPAPAATRGVHGRSCAPQFHGQFRTAASRGARRAAPGPGT